MKTTTRLFSIIIMITLLAGCAPAPTPPPTATPTPPPTATHTPEPTATATLIPTPMIAAMPGSDDPYPSTLTRTTLTNDDVNAHAWAFDDLTDANPNLAIEAKRMTDELKKIGGTDITTYGRVDGTRWGVFARTKDRIPLILQKNIDGGKTWVNVVDASAYIDLVAHFPIDVNTYRLTRLGRPEDIGEVATADVITENNWMVYVFRDSQGAILAWYDAAEDVFKTVQGEILKQEVSYIPYEAGQTWEQVQKNNVIHWPLDNPEQFEKELAAMHEHDIQLEQMVDLGTNPDGRKYHQFTDAPTGWLNLGIKTISLSTLTSIPRATVAASLENPNGDEMVVVMSQITVQLATGEYRTVSVATVRNTNTILKMLEKYHDENDPFYIQNTSTNYIESLSYYNSAIIRAIMAKNPLTTPNLPKDYQMLAQLHDYNTTIGVTQAYERLINGEGTEADITLLTEKGLIPVYEALFEVDSSYHVETITP